MPEMPEVKNVVKQLKKIALNKKISDVLVFLPKLLKNTNVKELKNNLIGKKIQKIYNVGKFIVFSLNKNIFVVNHLRMEGKWHDKNYDNNKHDHLSIIFSDRSSLIYNDSRQFGTFHLFFEDPINFLPLKKLAQVPSKTNAVDLYNRLQRKNIAIKTALLDQTLLVGLGNIYVNEVLFVSKIDPRTKSNLISQREVKTILENSVKILDKATKMGGTSIDSFTSMNHQTGSYQKCLWVHGRNNLPCKKCGSIIKKVKVNGRGTYYCEKCQVKK